MGLSAAKQPNASVKSRDTHMYTFIHSYIHTYIRTDVGMYVYIYMYIYGRPPVDRPCPFKRVVVHGLSSDG